MDTAAAPPQRLRLHAGYDAHGEVRSTWLLCAAGQLALWDEPAPTAQPLPPAAVPAVFRRYGRPLDEQVVLPQEVFLEVPLPAGTARLRPLRFRPLGHVEPLDYLVLERSGAEPLAAPAPLVAAALRALAAAAAR